MNLLFNTHDESFANSKNIDAAIEKHDKTKKDYFSVTKLQDRLFDGDANPINHDINELKHQTQDLEPLYMKNSGFYIFSYKIILIVEFRIFPNSIFFETKFPENIDIDNESDFKIAEIHLRKLYEYCYYLYDIFLK